LHAGLDIFRLVPSDELSANEIEAATQVRVTQFNPQMQEPFVWPATFAVARAYVDQLARGQGLRRMRLLPSGAISMRRSASPTRRDVRR
jgi:hypothetical protein